MNVELPVRVSCDRRFVIYITVNPVFHERTKNFEIDLRKKVFADFKDCLKWQEIALPKFSTESGGSKRHKSFGSSSFNTESREASINLNTNVGDNDEDDVQEIQRSGGMDKARAVGKKKGSKASGSPTVMRMHWLGEEYERKLFKVGEVGVILVGEGKGGQGGRP
nr:hypothetical protein [Tanacetum cinerariifolium]